MDIRVADGRTHVWMQLLSYAAAGVFAVILVSVSSYAFSGVAKQIPKKVTEVLCVSETGGRTCEKPDVFGDNFAGIAGTCG